MKQLLAIPVALASLAACTTIEPARLGEGAAARLRAQAVAIVLQDPADFGTTRPNDVVLGPAGMALMGQQGEALRKAAHIEDPAGDIATALADVLAGRHQATILSARGRARDDTVQASIAAAPADARYVLAVGTLAWGVARLPIPRATWQVSYLARARLIDVRTHAVVAEGGCLQAPDGSEVASSDYAQFTAGNAALVKTELAARVDRCLHFIQRDMLGA